jgi:hypothetical protein
MFVPRKASEIELKLARLTAVFPVETNLGLGPLGPAMTGTAAKSDCSIVDNR